MHAMRLGSLIITLLALTGCRPSGPQYVPVEGIVTIDGEPLALKTLYFSPEEGTPGLGAGASTDENGHYELLAVAPGATTDIRGVLPGTYLVTVSEPMIPLGTELVVQGLSDQPDIAVDFAQAPKSLGQAIPPAYANKESTPLRIQIVEGGGEVHLELTSNP